jgi:hypothetical protein
MYIMSLHSVGINDLTPQIRKRRLNICIPSQGSLCHGHMHSITKTRREIIWKTMLMPIVGPIIPLLMDLSLPLRGGRW